MKARENVPISSLTTMRLGGPARFVIEVENPSEVAEAYDFADLYHYPVFVLGGGANTIGRDEGFAGVIILNKIKGISLDGEIVRAGGGEIWDDLVAFVCEQGLTGIEAMSKIPGTVGAAPVQNIGAYGQDIAAVLESVEVFDSHLKKFLTLQKSDLGFSYRKSIFNSSARGRYFIITVNLRLKKGAMSRPFYTSLEKYIEDHHEIDFSPNSIRRMVSEIRDSKLPDPKTVASSGSFFKNVYLTDRKAEVAEQKGWPVFRGADGNKLNSGWLIEKVGLSGELIHGMRIHKAAALVLINESAKGYKDLAAARNTIVGKVYDKFGVWLEQEPVEIEPER